MNTAQATTHLAQIHRTGLVWSIEDRAADYHLCHAAERIREDAWQLADFSIEAAYRVLGANPPDANARDFAEGCHPIVLEADQLHREDMGEDQVGSN
jgi:hypothetical protein